MLARLDRSHVITMQQEGSLGEKYDISSSNYKR